MQNPDALARRSAGLRAQKHLSAATPGHTYLAESFFQRALAEYPDGAFTLSVSLQRDMPGLRDAYYNADVGYCVSFTRAGGT